MLNMGFEPQVRQIVQRGNMPASSSRQTMMFSATFPRDMQMLAKDFMKPEHIYMEFGELGCIPASITQKLLLVQPRDKLKTLIELLQKEDMNNRVLVFVQRKSSADFLLSDLQRSNFHVAAIHGDMSQRARQRSLSLFRKGMAPILVATAVAARGLDIPDVKHVINYELPQDVEEYIHRVGRTGRVGHEGG
ncbi:unnamed protein product [Soboliphyme baturini]|uniref:Helicase C-terminal domain-containing protein n=1 Tax=Soboliphyme baturini TaxID=241478 RepID=A0A183J2S1_9BILA|nr:unnamed protein product [Soboliphyme baturini]